jgi:hypothetical protein
MSAYGEYQLSGSLIDTYVKALAELEESAFQAAVVQRLLVALSNFQTVPSYPAGDGGLDGHSHKGQRAYCCYGLKYDSAKTPFQRAKQLAKKFSDDLARLFELEHNGKTKLVHKDNVALESIFGSVPAVTDRISHITLIANWFENHAALGSIAQNTERFAKASQCRWVASDVDVVLRGPKEFVDQYGVDESTMLWLTHKNLFNKMDSAAGIVTLPQGPTFDLKMTSAEDLLPDSRDEVKAVASDLRVDWQRAIVFEQEISDRVPDLHAALERGRRQLLLKVRTHPTSSPWEAITRAQEFAELIFSDDFSPIYGKSMVRDLSSGEVARLVGACPIDWKVKAPNGNP